MQIGRGKGRGGNHGGRGNNNSRAWRESIDEINHTKRSDGSFVDEKAKALNVSILIKI